MRTILVIDDDEAIRDSLNELLEQEGYSVACAENGEEGLRLLACLERPAVVLLDQNMPVMNGAEFLRRKATEARLAAVPVVVMSAEKNRCAAEGATGFLAKPFNVSLLLETLEHHAGAERREPALEQR